MGTPPGVYSVRTKSFELADEPIGVVVFDFVKNQLYSVILRTTEENAVKRVEWAGKIAKLLRSKYGRPHIDKSDDKVLNFSWDTVPTHINVYASPDNAWLSYESQTLRKLAQDARHKREQAQQKQDLDKL